MRNVQAVPSTSAYAEFSLPVSSIWIGAGQIRALSNSRGPEIGIGTEPGSDEVVQADGYEDSLRLG